MARGLQRWRRCAASARLCRRGGVAALAAHARLLEARACLLPDPTPTPTPQFAFFALNFAFFALNLLWG